MEENVKIAKIKKSCNVGRIVSKILFIVCLIASIACLAATITIFSMGKDFDIQMQKAVDAGYVSTDSSFGSVSGININLGDPSSLHSDIPSWQAAIDDHPFCIMYSGWCLVLAFATAVAAVMMKLIEGVFELIIKEDSPFTDKVIKRVFIVMIVISGMAFLTAGSAYGILGGIITWAVRAIMDYGKTLQIQSDETL
jgi:hypothetical protein